MSVIKIVRYEPPAESESEAQDTDLKIPSDIIPVPSGEIGYETAGQHIFKIIAPTNRLFLRGTTVHEVETDPCGEASLTPMSTDRFCALIETFNCRIARRERRGDKQGEKSNPWKWVSVTFPKNHVDPLLQSEAARSLLPNVRQVVGCPVIVPTGNGNSAVLGKGWHSHNGGIYVTRDANPLPVSLDEAKQLFYDLLADFDFPSGGDASRALASIISPAMKIGGWIDDDFPLDIAEADQSQSGKTYRQKLICAIYREAPSAIMSNQGGVGSLDEQISSALIKGRPFIALDNFRGRLDSQILESAIRGHGKISARGFRKEAEVDCSPFLWQLSTNGAELTRDLANRSIITRIRKRPDGHKYQEYPEGDILAHVRAHQPRYLAAVHAVIREWVRQGRPATHESRHTFLVWCRTMDWIVQNIFSFPPLLDGHREEQLRTANPKLQWLRDVMNAALSNNYAGEELTALDLAEIAEENDIPMPNRSSTEARHMQVGKMLGKMFREAEGDELSIDGRTLCRKVSWNMRTDGKGNIESKTYVITDA